MVLCVSCFPPVFIRVVPGFLFFAFIVFICSPVFRLFDSFVFLCCGLSRLIIFQQHAFSCFLFVSRAFFVLFCMCFFVFAFFYRNREYSIVEYTVFGIS